MKKQVFFLCAMMVGSMSLSAQVTSLTSKNGHEVLPQAGDYSLSMDAIPLLNMAMNAVNVMSDSGNNGAHPNYVSGFDQTIVGKRYDSATEVTRVKLGIAHRSESASTFTATLDSAGTQIGETEDVAKMSATNVLLGYGKEMRRGHNRLQGFYGYEGLLSIGLGGSSNTYGTDLANGQTRDLSSSDGMSFGIGARGFVGTEYFFAPKMSIGAEFGWGIGITRQGRGSAESETNNGGDITTTETDGSSSGGAWGFEVDNGSGTEVLGGGSAALTLNLHF